MKGFAEGYYRNLTNKNIKFFGIIGKFSYYLLLLFSPGRMWFHTVVSLLILLPSPLVLGVIWIFFFSIPSSVILMSLPPQYLYTPMLSEPEADVETTVI